MATDRKDRARLCEGERVRVYVFLVGTFLGNVLKNGRRSGIVVSIDGGGRVTALSEQIEREVAA